MYYDQDWARSLSYNDLKASADHLNNNCSAAVVVRKALWLNIQYCANV